MSKEPLAASSIPRYTFPASICKIPIYAGQPIQTVKISVQGCMNAEVTRELLESSLIQDMPGWETRLFLITYPPGADASHHSHPVVGIGYVLQGTMVTAFDDDPEEIFTEGQSFQDKASFHRVSKNGSQTDPMRFLITYTVKKGEPNTTWPNRQPLVARR